MPGIIASTYRYFLLFVVCLSATTCAASAQSSTATASLTLTDIKTKCTLAVPAQWAVKTMLWSGKCLKNRADGNGVARIMSSGKVIGAWYGDAKAGRIDTGILEQGDERQLGTFDKNFSMVSIDGMEPNRAMEKADKAAKALAAIFDKAGNKGSAAFYRKKAEDLLYLAGN
jgi:hypothetical protein